MDNQEGQEESMDLKQETLDKLQCAPPTQISSSDDSQSLSLSLSQSQPLKRSALWQSLLFAVKCFHIIHYQYSPAINKVYPDFITHKWDRQTF